MSSVSQFSLAVVGFTFAACAPSAPPQPQYEYEVVSIEEQALEAISATPMEFEIAFEDDEAAWDRSQLFFNNYTSGAIVQDFDYPAPGQILRSRPGSQDKYIYEVERSQLPQGYRYVVSCQRRQGFAYLSERNARNLARFIRDGHLELGLLDR